MATPNGWLADRFRQCIRGMIDGIVVNNGTDAVAGSIRFDYTILVWADRATRQTQVRLTIPGRDAVVSTMPANQIDWPNQHIDLIPVGCIPSATMNCPTEPNRTLDQWANNPDSDMFFTSPPGTGAAPDTNVVSNLATYSFEVGTLPVRPGLFPTNFKTNMRFDSGRTMSPANGAALVDFTPTVSFSLSDSEVNQSALHIRDAQLNPSRTFPSWPNKTIPGRAGGSEPLHRLVDRPLQDANRSASIAFCKQTWGPNYATGGRQCDEYPFCSTYEGAATSSADNRDFPRGCRFARSRASITTPRVAARRVLQRATCDRRTSAAASLTRRKRSSAAAAGGWPSRPIRTPWRSRSTSSCGTPHRTPRSTAAGKGAGN
ncbi:hypothetical protein [Actinoplanes sp. NPDC049118]|uniref:hypothetical protein n=1 Tax=Actinoplanes sp. NPDC049118 TaxID=3155769 RepID=UPI0033FB2873